MSRVEAKSRVRELLEEDGVARMQTRWRRSELVALEQLVAKEEKALTLKKWADKGKE